MSDITISREDVEKVQAAAYKAKDAAEEGGYSDDADVRVSMEVLIEFCDMLLGRGSVDSFLRGQDMES